MIHVIRPDEKVEKMDSSQVQDFLERREVRILWARENGDLILQYGNISDEGYLVLSHDEMNGWILLPYPEEDYLS